MDTKTSWKPITLCETEPCGKCGCLFVCVVCPKHWPVDTVALCCALCGSVVNYVDQLLLITVKQAIRERITRRNLGTGGRGHKVYDESAGNEPSFGLVKEMIFFGLENGLSKQDIAEALEVSEEYVSLIGGS